MKLEHMNQHMSLHLSSNYKSSYQNDIARTRVAVDCGKKTAIKQLRVNFAGRKEYLRRKISFFLSLPLNLIRQTVSSLDSYQRAFKFKRHVARHECTFHFDSRNSIQHQISFELVTENLMFKVQIIGMNHNRIRIIRVEAMHRYCCFSLKKKKKSHLVASLKP